MEAPPGPLGPPPDYESALASSPAAPPANPIGPRGAGSPGLFWRTGPLKGFWDPVITPFSVSHWPNAATSSSDLEPPPDYCVAASLPSYEQAGNCWSFLMIATFHLEQAEQLKEKLLAGDVEDQREEPAPRRSRRNSPRDDWEGEEDITLLGNDFVFFTAFLTAFLFNWVSLVL